jgi:PIN domain nuclease of toxin-antitoxin system/antitoxin (DNA-binding transcriptional repressor) of toxin-antitoxin stability system
LVREVRNGRVKEIILAVGGTPAAKIVPYGKPARRVLGIDEGLADRRGLRRTQRRDCPALPWRRVTLRLLLDTRSFIWAAGSPANLSRASRAVLEDPGNEVFVSAAVAWEMTIKYALGKLTLPLDPTAYFPSRVAALGFRRLSISAEHALAVGKLPPYHNDPFDRIMVAQAQIEGLTLVTNDPVIAKYRVKSIAA